jgi:preprotein translocase subunit SecF
MNFRIIQKKNIWLGISLAMFVVFTATLFIWGLKFGIDFTGGSLAEVRFEKGVPTAAAVMEKLQDLGLSSLSIQPEGESRMILRFQETDQEKHTAVLAKLDEAAKDLDPDNLVDELRFDSVGPSIGQELKRKAVNAVFFVFIAIILYITYTFRKVSKPVASWKFGVSAIVAMFHDVIITLGIFAVLGKYFHIEINTPFVAAILTVIGYSVHDSIVVFDRIRENLPKSDEDFEGTVNTSLNQTLVRSINTSLTSLLTLTAIVIFGGESIRPFALALAIGIFIGTYSSIFVASPLLVVWDKFTRRA